MSHSNQQTATLAGGCFWGVEELFRSLKGVINTEVGYSGGSLTNPTYKEVKTGSTGHAEAIQIEFDASVISFEQILEFFFQIHDPTTLNRQGNDIGSQYRSSIFYHNEEQKYEAQKMIERVNKSGAWGDRPVATEIVPYTNFTNAEEYHQDYLQKNPNGYTCHFVRKINF